MIRWGIIGCGDVTEVKSGPALQQAIGSSLIAVMRRTTGMAEDYARRHGVAKWYERAEDLIHDPDVDAVYVATPPGSHLEFALQVCTAGKPCYVEKPMARNHAECAAMVDAFRAAKLPLFVAYYRRALPRFLKARELITSGAIGKVTSVNYRFSSASHIKTNPTDLPWRVRVEDSGGGLFLDLGCHTLDIIAFMVGQLSNVQGDAAHLAAPYDAEDAVAMTFTTVDGALGAATWNFAAGFHEDIIEITGTTGRIALSTFANEPVRVLSGSGEESFDISNPRHIQQPLIQTIVDELHGRGTCPSTGETAARTSAIIDTVLSGYYAGRNDSFWLRPQTWRKQI